MPDYISVLVKKEKRGEHPEVGMSFLIPMNEAARLTETHANEVLENKELILKKIKDHPKKQEMTASIEKIAHTLAERDELRKLQKQKEVAASKAKIKF